MAKIKAQNNNLITICAFLESFRLKCIQIKFNDFSLISGNQSKRMFNICNQIKRDLIKWHLFSVKVIQKS